VAPDKEQLMRSTFRRPSALVLMVALGLFGAAGCGPHIDPADLVLTNGHVATVDAARPTAEGVAVRGGTIVAVGSVVDIKAYIGEKTEVIDLNGRFAMPAFNDAHAHFQGVGEAKLELQLAKARNWEEIVAMVADAATRAKPGEWILGHGWHQEKWDHRPADAVEGFPTGRDLSRVAPNNPVLLTHASGHAIVVNARAMELAGVTPRTPNPPGGAIMKDKAGKPTGVFEERASGLVEKALDETLARRTPEQAEADATRVVETANHEFITKGIVSVTDAGVGFGTVELYKKLAGQGKLNVRIYVMVNEPSARLEGNLAKYRMIDAYDSHLTVRSIKRLMDGALGSRTAWMLESYTDMPKETGINTVTADEMKATAKLAIDNDFQLNTHAIGDRANREVLNLYEETFKANPGKKDLRWRVEHAQHISAADIPRFGALGVIPSMQGIHCTSDAPYVLARLGAARAEEGAYVWQKLMKTGAVIPNGTDAPVEEVDPLPGYYALTTRREKNGEVFFGDQKMTRDEALRAYTLNGAYAAFQEQTKGSLTPGKLADIVVLSADITKVPDDQIQKAEVLYTIVGGKVVYKK
jgi:predicted amidohydrolase YtcJ